VAIANFFEKSAKAASHVIRNFNPEEFVSRLGKQHVCISFDAAASKSLEGKALLELATDLLARLFPALSFEPLGSAAAALERKLMHMRKPSTRRLRSIDISSNPQHELWWGRDASRTKRRPFTQVQTPGLHS
jgi:hypothetical protein